MSAEGKPNERELTLMLRDLVQAAADIHFSTGCQEGWGRCTCKLAHTMRSAEKVIRAMPRYRGARRWREIDGR